MEYEDSTNLQTGRRQSPSDVTFRVDDLSYKNFLIRVRMQKLCPFYKFQRDFVNKVEIHICKFSQQLDHISHGKLILFYFFDISIIFFYFF